MSNNLIKSWFGDNSFLALLPVELRRRVLENALPYHKDGTICFYCSKTWITRRFVCTEDTDSGYDSIDIYMCDTCYPRWRDEYKKPNSARRRFLAFRARSKKLRKAKKLAKMSRRVKVLNVDVDVDISMLFM